MVGHQSVPREDDAERLTRVPSADAFKYVLGCGVPAPAQHAAISDVNGMLLWGAYP